MLARAPGSEEGRIVALDVTDGAIRWSRNLPSRSESSPLLDHGRLYFGSEDGTVYALEAGNGRHRVDLPRRRRGQGQPHALSGVLYFGDYSGHVQAISERTGRRLWLAAPKARCLAAAPSTPPPRWSTGACSSATPTGASTPTTPAPARWTGPTKPAPTCTPLPPSPTRPASAPPIYLGSYDGNFYAINARTGHVDWSYDAGGKISGSATILGNIVYFSDLGTHTHLRPRDLHRPRGLPDGHRRLRSRDQRRQRVYLTGYSALYDLAPTG